MSLPTRLSLIAVGFVLLGLPYLSLLGSAYIMDDVRAIEALGAINRSVLLVAVFFAVPRLLAFITKRPYPYFEAGNLGNRAVLALTDNAWKVRLGVCLLLGFQAQTLAERPTATSIYLAVVAGLWLTWECIHLSRASSIKSWLVSGVRTTARPISKPPAGATSASVPPASVQRERPSFEQALTTLQASTLSNDIKQALESYGRRLQREQARGATRAELLRGAVVFQGNPGTGKAEAATQLAYIYDSLGLVGDASVHRFDHTSIYRYELAPDQAVDAVSNDNRYTHSLVLLDGLQFQAGQQGDAVANALVRMVRKSPNGDFALALATSSRSFQNLVGGRDDVRGFFATVIECPDLQPNQLLHVAEGESKRRGCYLQASARDHLEEALEELHRRRDQDWRGSHEVEDIIELALQAQSSRLDREPAADPDQLQRADIERAIANFKASHRAKAAAQAGAKLPFEGQSVEELLLQLEAKPGMANVKSQVEGEVALKRQEKARVEQGLNPLKTSGHLVFAGNPGTGKTTVAELLGAIYRELGVLSKGQLVVATRGDLVGEYQGHTAPKTKEVLQRAEGGILFIDEAYSLVNAENDTFGQEAVDALVGFLDDPKVREGVVCILAGYPSNMTNFLDSNPGLASRFPNHISFPDYAPDELVEIAEVICKDNGFTLTPPARELLDKGLERMFKERDPANWGNAREVRNLLEWSIKAGAVREYRAGLSHQARLEVEDVREALATYVAAQRSRSSAGI